jgi:hypothetical protein
MPQYPRRARGFCCKVFCCHNGQGLASVHKLQGFGAGENFAVEADQTSPSAHRLYHAVKEFDLPDFSLPFMLDLFPQHSIFPPQVFDMGLEPNNLGIGTYSGWRRR